MSSINVDEVIMVGKQWTLRTLARALLVEEGYQVLAFEEIDDLVASLKKRINKPLLIILDLWGLPLNERQVESLTWLSKRQRLLLCMGSQDEFDAELPGSPIILRRPFSIGELVQKVKEIRRKTARK